MNAAWRRYALAAMALAGLRCAPGGPADPPPSTRPVSDAGPGPAVGATVPAFELSDHSGRQRALADLRGPNGLLINFNRSVVW